jgi:hypothetical protein
VTSHHHATSAMHSIPPTSGNYAGANAQAGSGKGMLADGTMVPESREGATQHSAAGTTRSMASTPSPHQSSLSETETQSKFWDLYDTKDYQLSTMNNNLMVYFHVLLSPKAGGKSGKDQTFVTLLRKARGCDGHQTVEKFKFLGEGYVSERHHHRIWVLQV